MKILIWGELKLGGPYDVFRRLDYKNIFNELIDNCKANLLNVGNKVWIQGLISELTTEENQLFFYNPQENWDVINYKYDKIIYSAANLFCKSYINVIDKITEIFKNSKIPVYVISVGTQAVSYDMLDQVVEETKSSVYKFMECIYSTGGEIACRGYFTKEYLDKIARNTAEVVGCPSLYQNGGNLFINKSFKYNRVLFNGNVPFSDGICKKNPGSVYIDQDRYLRYKYDLSEYDEEQYVREIISTVGYKNTRLFLDGRIEVFYDIPEWRNYILKEGFDFSVGSRIHGNIVSLLSGIPVAIFPVDSRVREMAEFYHIPMVKSVNDYYDINKLYEYIEYDDFNKNYPIIYDNYQNFLKKCGLIKEINEDNIFWGRDMPLNNDLVLNQRIKLNNQVKNACLIEKMSYRICSKYKKKVMSNCFKDLVFEEKY